MATIAKPLVAKGNDPPQARYIMCFYFIDEIETQIREQYCSLICYRLASTDHSCFGPGGVDLWTCKNT
jgi:hypothetical protein